MKVTDRERGTENYYDNSVYIVSPHLYRSEISGQHGKTVILFNGDESLSINEGVITENCDIHYPFSQFLFIAQEPDHILQKLVELGINTEKTSLTRFDNKIAYRIGENEMEYPVFIVEKENFRAFLKF